MRRGHLDKLNEKEYTPADSRAMMFRSFGTAAGARTVGDSMRCHRYPTYLFIVIALCGIFLIKPAVCHAAARHAAGATANSMESAVIYRATAKSTADLSSKTRVIRVLVHFDRTKFFVANGRPYGLEAEAFAEYEKFLNKNRSRRSPKISIVFIPLRFDELIPALRAGKGDIAAGMITATADRKELVSFADPYLHNVSEILVANKDVPIPSTPENLSGKTIHVLRGSSYVRHLKDLNSRLTAAGHHPATIVEMPSSANDEDILEMVSSGMLSYTVTDNCVAGHWAKILPGIRLVPDVAVAQRGSIAWAVRKNNPALLGSLNQFVTYAHKNLQGTIAVLWNRYFQSVDLIKNPLTIDPAGRFKTLSPHFKEAGSQNKMDWLMMMAQGFQESGLDQTRKSPRGAIGVMQLLPQTARSVGYKDISMAKSNIAAGVAYLNYIRTTYFSDPAIPPDARVDFSLAAYNAGPARIQALRKVAQARGLNPNLWFGNVERVALDKVGEEPVRYVANINKYYIAYRLTHEMAEEKNRHGKAL